MEHNIRIPEYCQSNVLQSFVFIALIFVTEWANLINHTKLLNWKIKFATFERLRMVIAEWISEFIVSGSHSVCEACVCMSVERRYCTRNHIKQMNTEYSFDKLSIAVAMYCLIQHVFLLRDRVMPVYFVLRCCCLRCCCCCWCIECRIPFAARCIVA